MNERYSFIAEHSKQFSIRKMAEIEKVSTSGYYDWVKREASPRMVENEKIYHDIEYYCDGKCAVVSLTTEQMQNVDIEDGNGVSTIPRQIEGVEVGVVFKQRGNGWKASLRSNNEVDVQAICVNFGGGGHKKAAGCSFNNTSLEDAKKLLIAEIEKVLA